MSRGLSSLSSTYSANSNMLQAPDMPASLEALRQHKTTTEARRLCRSARPARMTSGLCSRQQSHHHLLLKSACAQEHAAQGLTHAAELRRGLGCCPAVEELDRSRQQAQGRIGRVDSVRPASQVRLRRTCCTIRSCLHAAHSGHAVITLSYSVCLRFALCQRHAALVVSFATSQLAKVGVPGLHAGVLRHTSAHM